MSLFLRKHFKASGPCLLEQGLLLLLLPGVLLRLELLHVLLLLSLDEVLQAHSSHEELGLDENKCREAQQSLLFQMKNVTVRTSLPHVLNNLDVESLRPGEDVPSLRSGPLAPAPLGEGLYSPGRE